MDNLKNKKLIIILALALFSILLILGIVIFWRQRLARFSSSPTKQISNTSAKVLSTPNFLTKTEKQKLKISPKLKVQALKRDAQGEVMVYKIIKSNSDIISNPTKIKPLEPTSKK